MNSIKWLKQKWYRPGKIQKLEKYDFAVDFSVESLSAGWINIKFIDPKGLNGLIRVAIISFMRQDVLQLFLLDQKKLHKKNQGWQKNGEKLLRKPMSAETRRISVITAAPCRLRQRRPSLTTAATYWFSFKLIAVVKDGLVSNFFIAIFLQANGNTVE